MLADAAVNSCNGFTATSKWLICRRACVLTLVAALVAGWNTDVLAGDATSLRVVTRSETEAKSPPPAKRPAATSQQGRSTVISIKPVAAGESEEPSQTQPADTTPAVEPTRASAAAPRLKLRALHTADVSERTAAVETGEAPVPESRMPDSQPRDTATRAPSPPARGTVEVLPTVELQPVATEPADMPRVLEVAPQTLIVTLPQTAPQLPVIKQSPPAFRGPQNQAEPEIVERGVVVRNPYFQSSNATSEAREPRRAMIVEATPHEVERLDKPALPLLPERQPAAPAPIVTNQFADRAMETAVARPVAEAGRRVSRPVERLERMPAQVVAPAVAQMGTEAPAQPTVQATSYERAVRVDEQALVVESITDEPIDTVRTADHQPLARPEPLLLSDSPVAQAEEVEGPFEIIDHTAELQVTLRRSKLLRTKVNIYRTAVVDPSVCTVVQFTPREVSIIGLSQGATHVTFWFEDDEFKPLTYLVQVVPDPEVPKRREQQYMILEEIINELFPDSKIRLVPVANKLIVQGQAKDAEEAAQIMSIIRGEAIYGRGSGPGFGGLVEGLAADPLVQEETNRRLPATQVINMLRVPGEQQVALRVKIAELNRSAARRFGVDLDMSFDNGNVLLQSLLNVASGSTATVLGQFDGDQINFGIHYLEERGVVRLLSEPTLVTLSGRPASFVAGGEFAVPTTVGVGGAAAVTTDFRAFGAIVTFLPVVIDKDRIRLQVSPEFSQVNQDLAVNDTPGLNTRAVSTTIEMREGQTLAIAGLLDDSMQATLHGSVPFLYKVLGLRNVTRNETELIILVTPELVHPLDPEEVPPLPGFDVTEPTNFEFFAEGKLEGKPTHDYRSTVWPNLKQRYRAGGSSMISGPFGHGQ